MSKPSRKVPELRFKGFTDDWELRKLEKESDIIAGGDIDKEKISDIGRYPVIANALTNDGIVGFYQNDYRIEAPAVTVTGRGDVGHASARSVNFTPVVRLLAIKSEHDIDFLANAINNHKILVESTGVPQLTSPQLGNYKIYFPTLYEEKRIGVFLKIIDKIITLHQRKLDALNRLKVAYLQGVFPKNGETMPSLRFANFEGNWEQRKLSEVTDRLKAYPLSRSAETIEYTGFKYIHYGDIHTGKANLVDINSNLPNINPGDYESLQKGDITLADASEDYQGIASPAVIIDEVPHKIISGLHTIALRPKIADSLFLYYLFHSPIFKRFGHRVGTGMKVFGISISNLQKFVTYYPSVEEQIKVRSLLKNLNDSINLQKQKLEQLQSLKKAYLQKMFV